MKIKILTRLALAFAVILAGESSLRAASANAAKPNIVFILIDDMGWRDLSCMGSQFYESPAIDKLASEGLSFTRAYEAAPRCVQSRTSIMTGKNHNRPELRGERGLALDQGTIGKAFQQGGYQTFYAGKWHLGGVESYWPQNRGFDINVGGCSLGALGTHFWPYYLTNSPSDIGPRESHNVAPYGLESGKPGEYIADRLTDETIKFLKSHKAEHPDQPFLVYLAHYQVHQPLEAKADDVKYFAEKLKKTPAPLGPDFENDYTGKVKLKQDLPVYAAMVKSIDDSVAHIRQALAELGYDKNTVIVFTSDNGGLSTSDLLGKRSLSTSNKPLRTGKGWLYEGGNRVPLIVYWPGVTPVGVKTDRATVGTDYFPTFLDIAGLPLRPNEHLDGESFAPVLKGDFNYLRQKPIYWYFDDAKIGTGNTAMAAMLDGDKKLVQFIYEKKDELYDVRQDIGEHTNLAAANPETVAAMKQKLAAWEKDVGIKPLKQHQIDEIKKIIAETTGEKGEKKSKDGKKSKKNAQPVSADED
jgi:arylsulfatase A-like enzyme